MLTNITLGLVGCVAFSLLSSSVYIFNDWADLEADRLHKKKLRPLASGQVNKAEALMILIVLVVLLGALGAIFKFPSQAVLFLLIYGFVSMGYSSG